MTRASMLARAAAAIASPRASHDDRLVLDALIDRIEHAERYQDDNNPVDASRITMWYETLENRINKVLPRTEEP